MFEFQIYELTLTLFSIKINFKKFNFKHNIIDAKKYISHFDKGGNGMKLKHLLVVLFVGTLLIIPFKTYGAFKP